MKEIFQSIPKFTGADTDDFMLWQQKVTMYLSTKDLETCIEKDPDSTATADQLRNDKKAKSIICMCIHDSIVSSVINEPTAKRAWDLLESLYRKKSRSTRTRLIAEFWNCTKDDAPMATYVATIQVLQSKLRAIGKDMTDEDMTDRLLSGLPSTFDAFTVTLDSCHEITFASTAASLINFEAQLEHRSRETLASSNLPQAFATTGNRSFRCTYHKSNSHDNNHCWAQHPELRPNTKWNKSTDSKYQRLTNHVALSTQSSSNKSNSSWLLDCACSSHMCSDSSTLHTILPHCDPLTVTVANNATLHSASCGTYKFQSDHGVINLSKVSHVPGLSRNLISIGQATSDGLEFRFKGDFCKVLNNSGQLITEILKDRNNMYEFPPKANNTPERLLNAAHMSAADTYRLWHNRLGHINDRDLKAVLQRLPNSSATPSPHAPSFCEGCMLGKMPRGAINRASNSTTTRPLEVIHSDIAGPFPVDGFHCKSRYYITFLDQHTRYTFVYLLQKKSEATSAIRRYIRMVNTHFQDQGISVKSFQSDNGGEFISKDCETFFAELGIVHRKIIPYQSEQNGMIERLNRTIIDCAESMRHSGKLEPQFWTAAIRTAVYIINRRPHSALTHRMTPFEAWNSQEPEICHLRTFGCDAYVHLPNQLHRKLQPRGRRVTFIGYPSDHKGYQFWDRDEQRIIVTRLTDATFDENSFTRTPPDCLNADATFPFEMQHSTPSEQSQPPIDGSSTFSSEPLESLSQSSADSSSPHSISLSVPLSEPAELPPVTASSNSELNLLPSGHQTRNRRPPGEWWKAPTAMLVLQRNHDSLRATQINIPKSISEALDPANEFVKEWTAATKAELDSLQQNETWELVKLPSGRNAIQNKWVFKVKSDEKGLVDKFKARLVVKGYSQRPGIDFDETFSPVAHLASIRLIFALAASLKLKLRQLDVVGAFLQAELHEEIYMVQPEGHDSEDPSLVCRLKKSLYGLKQAGLVWNNTINLFLTKDLGFKRLSSDACVYVMRSKDDIIIMSLSTDDLLMAHNCPALAEEVVAELSKRFPMTDLGEPKRLLGMRISSSDDGILLDQETYILEQLSKFQMMDSKQVDTPEQPGFYLDKDMCATSVDEKQDMKGTPFRELVGALNWIATCTRPDISHAVSSLCRYLDNPGRQHWTSAKRVLKYLKGSSNFGLFFQAQQPPHLIAYSDSDWAGDRDSRKSTTGYTLMMSGSAIAWRSSLQKIVACSSTEAEYIALSETMREVIWIRQMLTELGFSQKSATRVLEDNQGCIAISKNRRTDKRTKHIDLRFHFCRDQIEQGAIEVEYCPTESMIADGLTKPINAPKFKWCRTAMGITASKLRGRVEYNLPAPDEDHLPSSITTVGATLARS